jgi:hypothetical protein
MNRPGIKIEAPEYDPRHHPLLPMQVWIDPDTGDIYVTPLIPHMENRSTRVAFGSAAYTYLSDIVKRHITKNVAKEPGEVTAA